MPGSRVPFKVYVTKYALTQGIEEKEVVDCFDISPVMVKEAKSSFAVTYHNNEWYYTKEKASARADEMRINKIKSLEKQLNKLKNLNFNN